MSKQRRTTAAYTTEFHYEFRIETGRLLRRRFLWFTGVVGSLALLSLAVGLYGTLFGNVRAAAATSETAEVARGLTDWRWWVLASVWCGIYIAGFIFALLRRPSDERLLRLSLILVTLDGLINIGMRALDIPNSFGLGGFFVSHMIACLFLPWTPWQSLRPMGVVLLANVALELLFEHPVWSGTLNPGVITGLAFSPLLAMPGMIWCWARHSKRTQDFKYRFMSSRYTEMRRELVDARKIHESLFPEPIDTGVLRLTFEYEPMRQIGGDFLYTHCLRRSEPDSPVSIVLLDVTGHGIPAALTVNRLHGELERVFAETPSISPGEVLKLLNRYVHLTLATHSIYVTAFCARVDPDGGTLEYASGGHPPGFLRAVDGTIEELSSTSFVLGACADDAFDAQARSLRFGPGDAMLAYTDGAIEATGPDGKMLRITGLQGMLAQAAALDPGAWAATFREQVVAFRGGPPADDTLFLVLHRPVAPPKADERPDRRESTVSA